MDRGHFILTVTSVPCNGRESKLIVSWPGIQELTARGPRDLSEVMETVYILIVPFGGYMGVDAFKNLLKEHLEDLVCCFRKGHRAESMAVAQPSLRGGQHTGPMLRRCLSEGLGVTRKAPVEADTFLHGGGCCQTMESIQAGSDHISQPDKPLLSIRPP